MLQFVSLLFIMHSATPDSMRIYNDTLGRYTIQYPASWQQTKMDNAIGFLSPQDGGTDVFLENVNVIVQDLSQQPLTLQDYTVLSKSQYTDAYGPSAVVSIKDTTLAGYPAEVGIFLLKSQGQTVKLKQFWFIKNKTAYLLTYSAQPEQFGRYLPVAMKVICSFKPLK